MHKYYPIRSFQLIHNAEAALDLLVSSKNGYEVERAFVQFLEAAKHVLEQLQVYGAHIPGFKQWYEENNTTVNDSLCKYFYKLRSEVVKGNATPIAHNMYVTGQIHPKGGEFNYIAGTPVHLVKKNGIEEWQPTSEYDEHIRHVWKLRLDDNLTDYAKYNGPEVCKLYLDKLKSVVNSFVLEFNSRL